PLGARDPARLARSARPCVRSAFRWPRSPRPIPFPPPPPPPHPGRCSAGSQVLRDRLTSHDRPSRDYGPGPSPHDPPYHHHKRVTVRPTGSHIWRLRACTASPTPRGKSTAPPNTAH